MGCHPSFLCYAAVALVVVRSCVASNLGTFEHGVASGDPLAERIMLWTRITPRQFGANAPIVVVCEVGTDPQMRSAAATVHTQAAASSDWTVKLDVGGLEPGQRYYYRFR